jgi:GxxExxY protein
MRKLTEIIIGCAMKVHSALGVGFLEKVYENALVHELRKAGLTVRQQVPIGVFYDGIQVGDYIADLVVEGKVLLELKAVTSVIDEFSAICHNYLRATNLPVCLLMNFAKVRLEWKRIVGNSYLDEPAPL